MPCLTLHKITNSDDEFRLASAVDESPDGEGILSEIMEKLDPMQLLSCESTRSGVN